MSDYNEASIQQLSGLEHIRHRLTGYVVDSNVGGLYGILKEIIDNSVDELSFAHKDGELCVIMFINRDKKSFQPVVIDNGRGIPVGKLISVFADTNTSGKFDTNSYAFSAGSFGVGSSVTLALSKWFRAITMNNGVIGDATIHHSDIPNDVKTVPNTLKRSGTIVMFEPDNHIFTGIETFAKDHTRLLEFLVQLSLFGTYHIKFIEVEHEFPKAMRTANTLDLIEYLDEISKSDIPVYDSFKLDKEAYIKGFFGMTRKWDAEFPLKGANSSDTLRIQGHIMFSLANVTVGNNKLTMVNDILFTDNASLHISMLYKFIKDRLAGNITDKTVKTFFIDHYKLPIWLVLDIKYAGAVFSGMAKTSFRDVSFRSHYSALLNEILDHDVLQSMYNLMADNIQLAFNKFSNKDFSTTGSMRNLMSRLNRPEKFNNCSTTDRSSAELFLVEGDSAKSDQDRNSIFQASYTLGGKPFNGLTDVRHIPESINSIKKNAVFQDIIRILNITPGSDDLSNLNFGKTFVMADADTHGYHITNIVIGNLYVLCPALINEGHIYITIPPLYSLNIKGSAPIYIRNATELNATLAYHVYHRCLDVKITSARYSKILSRDELVAFSELVVKIAEELERLSNEYMIPALLLEQLSLLTGFLNLKNPNIKELEKWLGYDIKYSKSGHLLIISIGSEDVIVPLNQITDLIYARILPMYREFYYGKTRIFVTTKNSPALKDSPTTIIQLNEMFKRMNNMFTIQRYKGLGSMPPEDRSRNCLAPSTRRVIQITNIGDVSKVFAMLGTDSTERKKLIVA